MGRSSGRPRGGWGLGVSPSDLLLGDQLLVPSDRVCPRPGHVLMEDSGSHWGSRGKRPP